MNNKEAHESLFDYSFLYDKVTDQIYHFPCDDLHGTFNGSRCNCRTNIRKTYLKQTEIDLRIENYFHAQKLNEGVFRVSVKMSGYTEVYPCKSNEVIRQNTLYHRGDDRDFTMYCKEGDVEETKKHLIELCRAKHDKLIKEKIGDKECFESEIERLNSGQEAD